MYTDWKGRHKLCLSADDITVYVKNHNESMKKAPETNK